MPQYPLVQKSVGWHKCPNTPILYTTKDIRDKTSSPFLLLYGFHKFYLFIYQIYWGISTIVPVGEFYVFVTCRCLVQCYQLLLSFWMYLVVKRWNYHSQIKHKQIFLIIQSWSDVLLTTLQVRVFKIC